MKLLRFGNPGQEKPGLIDTDGNIRDLSGIISDIEGSTISPEGLNKINQSDISSLPVVSDNPRIGPCVGNVGKFLCIGLNYSDHAAETGAEAPPEPILFQKATSAIIGPNDDVEIPKTSKKTFTISSQFLSFKKHLKEALKLFFSFLNTKKIRT